MNRTAGRSDNPHRGRRRLARGQARELQDRLWEVMKDKFNKDRGRQAALARKLGVSPSVVCGWFGAEARCPEVETLIRIAERLSISLNWLLAGIGSKELRRLPPTAPLPDQLRDAITVQVRLSRTASKAEVEASVPAGNELFEKLLKENLERLDLTRKAMRLSGRRRRGPPAWRRRRQLFR